MSCPFCDIVSGQLPASVVATTDRVLAFSDIHPVNPGHVLVVPAAHATGLEDLDPDVGAEMFRVAHRVAGALRRTDLRCEGVNLFLSDGEAAFQEVFHVHLHVIPRYRGDRFRLSSGRSRKPTARADLDDVAERIRERLGS
ncbi:HIT family protein [Pseudonocardia nematodicida]|uniref:HIT family protein n=1 Tax=Pseudonocardia nematodicida TaxID=1206997 RepID=A0ABV1KJF8_9PSEU